MRARKLTSTVVVSLGMLIGSLALTVAPALAAAPSVTVDTPTGMTGATVQVTGTVNPNGTPGAPTTFWDIQYARASEPGAWNETALAGEFAGAEAELKTPQPVGGTIEGLEPNTAYEERVFAINEAFEEANPMPEEPVSTLAIAASLVSETATALTPFEARLEAVVNPNNQVISCEFQYGTTTAFATHVACEPPSLEGFFEQGVGLTLTGLEAGKTYHSRVLLENANSEITTGADVPFDTPPSEKPTVDSESVTPGTLSSTAASLEAKVNPNYQETSYSFEYATSAADLGTPSAITVPGAPPAAELTAVSEERLAGPVELGDALTPGQTYFYRVLATNATGTTEGPVQSFQALDLPVPSTGEASEVTGSTARLAGTVNPAGAPTTYYFAYTSEAGYREALAEGSSDPYAQGGSTPEGTTTAAYTPGPTNPLTAVNLQPGTTYHYALVASNSVGSVTGLDETFTTAAPAPAPVALTGAATGITTGTATLTGSVETQGLPANAAFEFGSTPALGTIEGATRLPGATGGTPVSFAFNGYLSPGATYYYRVVVTNTRGTSYGAERSFTTVASPSAALSPVTPLLSVPEEAQPNPAKPKAPKALTQKQKLARALKACGKQPKGKRAACERAARKRYRQRKAKQE